MGGFVKQMAVGVVLSVGAIVTPVAGAGAQPSPVIVPAVGSVIEGDAPASVTVEVPVTLSAPSGSQVTVQWNTLMLPQIDPLVRAEEGVDYTAASGQVIFAPGDTDETVSITVLGDDVGEATELIVVQFHTPVNATIGGFYGLGVGAIEDDDGRAVVVTPNVDVNGGDIVTVSGFNWTPNVGIGVCQADGQAASPPQDGCVAPYTTRTTDSAGSFSLDIRVRRWGWVPARQAFIDCEDPATPCRIGAAEISDLAGTATYDPLSFADPPPPPVTRGQIEVEPWIDVVDGQNVTVTGSGFRGLSAIELRQCLDPVGLPSDCDRFEVYDVVADVTGAFGTVVSLDEIVDNSIDCRTSDCAVAASEAVDFVGTVVSAPISFDSGPSVVVPAVGDVDENDSGLTEVVDVPVSLSEPSNDEVTVGWNTITMPQLDPLVRAEAGVDYVSASGTVTFASGVTDAVVPITVLGDDLEEADELIVVQFHTVTNGVLGGFYGLGVGIIVDDDGEAPTGSPAPDVGVEELLGSPP